MAVDKDGKKVLLLIGDIKTLFRTLAGFRNTELDFSSFKAKLEVALDGKADHCSTFCSKKHEVPSFRTEKRGVAGDIATVVGVQIPPPHCYVEKVDRSNS